MGPLRRTRHSGPMQIDGTPSANNRRQARRFPMALPLETGHGTAETRDVSALGASFVSSHPVAMGDRLHCALVLRPGQTNAQRLEFEAHVVRVERHGNEYHVAARFDALQSDVPGLAEISAQTGGGIH